MVAVDVVGTQVLTGAPAAEERIGRPEDDLGDGDDRPPVAPVTHDATVACDQGTALRDDSHQYRFDAGGPEPPVPPPG